jgi:hypothetical protein
MRKTRLSNFVSERASNFLLYWYKEAKKTHDIEAILSFKSFVKRIIEAQDEYEVNGRKAWTDVDNYIDTVLSSERHINYFNYKDTLDYIVRSTKGKVGPFNYIRKNDLLKLL